MKRAVFDARFGSIFRAAIFVLAASVGQRAIASGPADFLRIAPATHEVFAYFDVAQMRTTTLYEKIKNDLLGPDVQGGLAAFEQFTGMRLPDDLNAVAASGRIEDGQNQGCVYINGRMDRMRLETILSMNPGYTEIPQPAGKVIGFLDEGKGTMSYLSFLKDDLVVIGQKEPVEAAVDTYGGERDSMAENATIKTLLGDAGTSPLVMVIARRPAVLPPNIEKVPVLPDIQTALLTLVGGKETMTVRARLVAQSREMAGRWLDIARGLIALGQVQRALPQVARIAENANARQKDVAVEISVPIEVDLAADFIRKRIAERRARRPNVGGVRMRGEPQEQVAPAVW